MKLAIYTQIKQNYGTADKPYWKFKGGETYIVPNLSAQQADKIRSKGIPTLTSLIEEANVCFEVYVQNWAILDDDVATHDDWEAPYILSHTDGRWVCTQVQEGQDWGFAANVRRCTKTYIMGKNGEKFNYQAMLTLVDGSIIDYQDWNASLAA